jgi:DcuC family C4-dicarboxylate transporter
MSLDLPLIAAVIIIAVTMYALVREADVRLVLFAAGLALALVVRKPLGVFDTFLAEMGNGKTIGPICTGLGYAYVLRATGCDREMVKVLLAPVKKARWLLIPVGCLVGWVTNIAITSQTAVAAAVGPILLPLMLAAGFHPFVAGATLLLGVSGGGSLFNPGDADLVAIHEAAGGAKISMSLPLAAMLVPLITAFVTAVIVFLLQTKLWRITEPAPPLPETVDDGPPQRWKALLPPLPVIMVFAFLPGLFFKVPPAPFEKGLPVGLAMLVSTGLVMLLCRKDLSKLTKQFFDGMGYAFGNIISLIATANCFIAGLTEVGLTQKLVKVVSGVGIVGKLAAWFFPLVLAIIAGTGIGPSVAFSKAVVPKIAETNLAAGLDLGVMGAIAASFGRTMSPVSAVVIFCCTLAGVPVLKIVKRTALPLIFGSLAALAVIVARS